jgi:hypothetical protein
MNGRKLAKTVETSVDSQADKQQTSALPIAANDRIVLQLFAATWTPRGASKQEIDACLAHAFRLLQEHGPRDASEKMLVSQMVAAHGAAMEFMRRSTLPDEPFVATDYALKQAEKWMTVFRKHLDDLVKHRSRGQQHVTVKHVYFGPGAQAVFGNVADSSQTFRDEFQPPKDVTPVRRRPAGGAMPSNENKEPDANGSD